MEAILGHVLNGLSPHQMWLKDKPPAEEGVARSFGNWHMLIVLTDIRGYFGIKLMYHILQYGSKRHVAKLGFMHACMCFDEFDIF